MPADACLCANNLYSAVDWKQSASIIIILYFTNPAQIHISFGSMPPSILSNIEIQYIVKLVAMLQLGYRNMMHKPVATAIVLCKD